MEFTKLTQKIAVETIVLLKNGQDSLPLEKGAQVVFLEGRSRTPLSPAMAPVQRTKHRLMPSSQPVKMPDLLRSRG